MSMITNGVKTNPAANTILADAVMVADIGGSEVYVIVSSTIGAAITYERIDVDGTTVLNSHTFAVSANGNFTTTFFDGTASGQHLRIRTNGILVGSVQGTITSPAF